MTTRDDILFELRRGNLTTTELVERLGLSRNAVVVPLGQLVGEGLVRRATVRRSGQAGKPAHEFEAVPGHEDTVSTAYRPFTELMLTVLPRHQERDAIEALMRDIGREMAAGMPPKRNSTFADRLAAARDVVDDLGAATEIVLDGERLMVQSHSCPLATAVRKEACVCQAVAAFFEAATGSKVSERCRRRSRLTCRFEFDVAPSDLDPRAG